MSKEETTDPNDVEAWECEQCPKDLRELKEGEIVYDQTGEYEFCSEKCHEGWLADVQDAADAQADAERDRQAETGLCLEGEP